MLRREVGFQRTAAEARAGGTEGRLAELPLVELRGGMSDERFELELSSGVRVRIPPRFEAEALERLLAVVK
jgi:hypothetical protein